jgi:hypothetical protein
MALAILGLGCAQAPPVAPIAPPPRTLALSPATARQVALRLNETAEARGPFTLRLSEDELSSYLAYEAETAPLREIGVWFDVAQVTLQARMPELGDRRLLAVAGLSIREGVPQVALHQLLLNGQTLPRLLVDPLQQALNDALADARLTVRLEEITLEEGSLTLRGEIE